MSSNEGGASTPGEFWFHGRHGRGLRRYVDLRTRSGELRSGTWALVAEFDGPWHAWEVDSVHECEAKDTCVIPVTRPGVPWQAPRPSQWSTSLDREGYLAGVRRIQSLIARGELAQANLCRVLSAPVPAPPPARSVYAALIDRHPAPYAGWFEFPAGSGPGAWLVSTSPELALEISGGTIRTSPIKGTARTAAELSEKDYLENRLVARAVREELRALVGEAAVTRSCHVEAHPGLVQLVSTLEGAVGEVRPERWGEILHGLNPPLSVAGVPKAAALAAIGEIEPVRRGPYCGAVGWIDVDRGQALLGVMIRSFWWERGVLRFGTGAGITAGSDPAREWEETRLKSDRLLQLLAEVDL